MSLRSRESTTELQGTLFGVSAYEEPTIPAVDLSSGADSGELPAVVQEGDSSAQMRLPEPATLARIEYEMRQYPGGEEAFRRAAPGRLAVAYELM